MRRVIAPALFWAVTSSLLMAFTPVLPTANQWLWRGQPAKFYMYTDRDFEGEKTTPWQGGGYGFTRGPVRLGGEVVLTKFHEGIDIQPLRRDRQGEPLDDVVAIEAGRIVHVSQAAGDSNYGRYIVVEHDVEGTPVYSLYAHLAAIDATVGQIVARGARLGRLGHTGDGINQRRAHLHLEIAVMWHDQFETWHAANFPTPNKHGAYNGINLMGLDVAEFYLAQRKDPSLALPEFVRRQPVAFRLQTPASPHFQLPIRYPWMVEGAAQAARSWAVSFTSAGFPVKIEPAREAISAPRVVWAQPSPISYDQATRSLLGGPPGQPQLGPSGQQLVELLTWDPASAPHPDG
ncbi:MAG: M23 family metallopeptidase [Chthoniobacterales bacterium]